MEQLTFRGLSIFFIETKFIRYYVSAYIVVGLAGRGSGHLHHVRPPPAQW